MTRNENLQVVQTAGFLLFFLGSIIDDHTRWSVGDYIKLAGGGVLLFHIIYMLVHWQEFREMNIAILVLLGLFAWFFLCLLIGLAVQ